MQRRLKYWGGHHNADSHVQTSVMEKPFVRSLEETDYVAKLIEVLALFNEKARFL